MPGLEMFGRRWSFGSDDLVLPHVVLALLHTAWYVTSRYVTLIHLLTYLLTYWRLGVVVIVVGRINEVNQHRARLVRDG